MEIATTNEATTRTVIGHNMAYGNAIVSLSHACKENNDGMYFSGNNEVTVTGGNIYSNSCMDGDGTVTVNAEPQGIYLTYPWESENKPSFSPTPSTIDKFISITNEYSWPTKCNVAGKLDTTSSPPIYRSGYYSKIKITNGTYEFEDNGIFCFNGSDVNTFEITGGTVTGDDVFFYVDSGNVSISGKATVKLIAQREKTKPYFGLLFYMPPTNSGLIKLVGNDESLFSGTVFAPTGYIEVGGTASMCEVDEFGVCDAETFSTQLIGWYVKVVGTSDIDILFDKSRAAWINGNFYLYK